MEDIELNNQIEQSTDENIILIKNSVDRLITKYKLGYDVDERNRTIIAIYEVIVKKFLTSENSKFTKFKQYEIGVITQAFVTQKWIKDHEDLENP